MLTILDENDAMLEELKARTVRELNAVREPFKMEHVNQVLNS